MEELSLCGLFLMDEAKKVDRMFGVPQSTQHTTSDATPDIFQIATYLLLEGACREDAGHKGDHVVDPMTAGSKKVAQGHLNPYLQGTAETEEHEDPVEGEVDLDYEIFHVT